MPDIKDLIAKRKEQDLLQLRADAIKKTQSEIDKLNGEKSTSAKVAGLKQYLANNSEKDDIKVVEEAVNKAAEALEAATASCEEDEVKLKAEKEKTRKAKLESNNAQASSGNSRGNMQLGSLGSNGISSPEDAALDSAKDFLKHIQTNIDAKNGELSSAKQALIKKRSEVESIFNVIGRTGLTKNEVSKLNPAVLTDFIDQDQRVKDAQKTLKAKDPLFRERSIIESIRQLDLADNKTFSQGYANFTFNNTKIDSNLNLFSGYPENAEDGLEQIRKNIVAVNPGIVDLDAAALTPFRKLKPTLPDPILPASTFRSSIRGASTVLKHTGRLSALVEGSDDEEEEEKGDDDQTKKIEALNALAELDPTNSENPQAGYDYLIKTVKDERITAGEAINISHHELLTSYANSLSANSLSDEVKAIISLQSINRDIIKAFNELADPTKEFGIEPNVSVAEADYNTALEALRTLDPQTNTIAQGLAFLNQRATGTGHRNLKEYKDDGNVNTRVKQGEPDIKKALNALAALGSGDPDQGLKNLQEAAFAINPDSADLDKFKSSAMDAVRDKYVAVRDRVKKDFETKGIEAPDNIIDQSGRDALVTEALKDDPYYVKLLSNIDIISDEIAMGKESLIIQQECIDSLVASHPDVIDFDDQLQANEQALQDAQSVYEANITTILQNANLNYEQDPSYVKAMEGIEEELTRTQSILDYQKEDLFKEGRITRLINEYEAAASDIQEQNQIATVLTLLMGVNEVDIDDSVKALAQKAAQEVFPSVKDENFRKVEESFLASVSTRGNNRQLDGDSLVSIFGDFIDPVEGMGKFKGYVDAFRESLENPNKEVSAEFRAYLEQGGENSKRFYQGVFLEVYYQQCSQNDQDRLGAASKVNSTTAPVNNLEGLFCEIAAKNKFFDDKQDVKKKAAETIGDMFSEISSQASSKASSTSTTPERTPSASASSSPRKPVPPVVPPVVLPNSTPVPTTNIQSSTPSAGSKTSVAPQRSQTTGNTVASSVNQSVPVSVSSSSVKSSTATDSTEDMIASLAANKERVALEANKKRAEAFALDKAAGIYNSGYTIGPDGSVTQNGFQQSSAGVSNIVSGTQPVLPPTQANSTVPSVASSTQSNSTVPPVVSSTQTNPPVGESKPNVQGKSAGPLPDPVNPQQLKQTSSQSSDKTTHQSHTPIESDTSKQATSRDISKVKTLANRKVTDKQLLEYLGDEGDYVSEHSNCNNVLINELRGDCEAINNEKNTAFITKAGLPIITYNSYDNYQGHLLEASKKERFRGKRTINSTGEQVPNAMALIEVNMGGHKKEHRFVLSTPSGTVEHVLSDTEFKGIQTIADSQYQSFVKDGVPEKDALTKVKNETLPEIGNLYLNKDKATSKISDEEKKSLLKQCQNDLRLPGIPGGRKDRIKACVEDLEIPSILDSQGVAVRMDRNNPSRVTVAIKGSGNEDVFVPLGAGCYVKVDGTTGKPEPDTIFKHREDGGYDPVSVAGDFFTWNKFSKLEKALYDEDNPEQSAADLKTVKDNFKDLELIVAVDKLNGKGRDMSFMVDEKTHGLQFTRREKVALATAVGVGVTVASMGFAGPWAGAFAVGAAGGGGGASTGVGAALGSFFSGIGSSMAATAVFMAGAVASAATFFTRKGAGDQAKIKRGKDTGVDYRESESNEIVDGTLRTMDNMNKAANRGDVSGVYKAAAQGGIKRVTRAGKDVARSVSTGSMSDKATTAALSAVALPAEAVVNSLSAAATTVGAVVLGVKAFGNKFLLDNTSPTGRQNAKGQKKLEASKLSGQTQGKGGGISAP